MDSEDPGRRRGRRTTPRAAPRPTRRALIAAAALLAPAVAAACGPAGGAVPGAEPTAPRLSGTLETWVSAYFPISGDAMWQELYDGFRARHPGLRVVAGEGSSRGDAEVIAKFTTAVASGDAPDVVHIGGIFAQSYARVGTLTNLEPYFRASRTLTKDELWPAWLADSTYKGSQYALPFAGDLRVLFLHRESWLSAGLDPKRPPRTWSELEEAVRALTRRDADGGLQRAGFVPATAPWLWPFWQLGGEQVDGGGERVVLDQGDAGVKALEFAMRLYEIQGGRETFTRFYLANGATEQNAGNPPGALQLSLFTQGKVAAYVNTYATRSEQFRPQRFEDGQWEYAAYPLPPGGRQVNYGGSHAFGVPSVAKNKDGAWAWLEHFALPENDRKFAVRYDRVPLRKSTAGSDAFLRGDPFLRHMFEQAPGRKFLTAVPGALDLAPLWNAPFLETYSGRRSPRDAIAQTAKEMQLALDKFLGKA